MILSRHSKHSGCYGSTITQYWFCLDCAEGFEVELQCIAIN